MPKKTPQTPVSNNSELEAKIQSLEAQLSEAQNLQRRLAADYANLEKRVETDRQTIAERAATRLLEELFPIMDNLYRASQHAPEIKLEEINQLSEDDFKKFFNYFSGLRMIEHQLEETLAQAGLSRITTTGELFNPELHEAISYEPNQEVAQDHIISEIEAGWQINDRVIRPAKVRVSQG